MLKYHFAREEAKKKKKDVEDDDDDLDSDSSSLKDDSSSAAEEDEGEGRANGKIRPFSEIFYSRSELARSQPRRKERLLLGCVV